jgi:hypothetical protein
MPRPLVFFFAVVATAVGCGGSSTPDLGGSSSGGSSTSSSGGSSTSSSSSSSSGGTCGTLPPIACFCGSPVCENGKWGCSSCKADAGSSFTCGTQTCRPSEMCTDMAPGIALPDGGTPPDYIACQAIPAACIANPTCDCIVTALKSAISGCTPSQCKVDASGHVTVYCLGA